MPVRRADGGWNWMRQTLTDLRDDPHVRSIVGNGVDITPWHEERQARARQEAHLRALRAVPGPQGDRRSSRSPGRGQRRARRAHRAARERADRPALSRA